MLNLTRTTAVYGLTKGQFPLPPTSAPAKRGETNHRPPIEPVLLALTLGRRSRAQLSGDKPQLVR